MPKYGTTEYRSDIASFFPKASDIAKPVLGNARKLFRNIEKYLYTAPSVINLVKSSIPVSAYQAVFTSDQLNRLADGSLKLMTDKGGRTLAKLVDSNTGKIFANVELRETELTPQLGQALTGFAMQMQMMMISEKLDSIQRTVDDIAQGMENDRLAAAYACRDSLKYALGMNDTEVRRAELRNVAREAIKSRNLLEKSQELMIDKIENFNSSFISSLFSLRNKTKENDKEIEKLKVNLSATFGASMVAAVAYEELNEMATAKESVQDFAGFLSKTYVNRSGLIDRLDMLDPSPDCFWSTQLIPVIKQIDSLPDCESINYLLKEDKNVTESM